MITESSIRRCLADYLRGNLSLDVFEDRIVSKSWNMHLDSPESAQKLVGLIELRLAEHSSGHLSESEMKSEFAELISVPARTSEEAVVK